MSRNNPYTEAPRDLTESDVERAMDYIREHREEDLYNLMAALFRWQWDVPGDAMMPNDFLEKITAMGESGRGDGSEAA